MGKISVPGMGTFTVDNSFGQLSPEQQQAQVNEMIAHVQSSQAPAQSPAGASQAATSQPQQDIGGPSSGIGTAAWQGLVHGLPAALENGAATIGQTIEDRTGSTGLDGIVQGLRSSAAENRQELSRNYQHPASVDPSITHALGQGNYLGALKSLGYNVAENAGTMGAQLGLAGVGAAAAVPTLGLSLVPTVAAEGALAADGIDQSKQAAGVKGTRGLSNGDMANLGVQTLMNSIPGEGAVARIGNGFLKGAAGSGLNQFSDYAQGGNVGTLGDAIRNSVDAGITGAALTGAGVAHGGAKQLANDHVFDPISAGPEWRKGLAELQAARNNKGPMTPAAQKVQTTLNANAFFDARRGAESADHGKLPPLTDTIKGDLDQGKAQLSTIFKGMRQAGPANGGVTPDQYDVLSNALKEAGNHNRNQAENGLDTGYTDTFRDKINALPLSPVAKANILDRLSTINAASYNGKKMNSKAFVGPLIRGMASQAIPLLGEYGAEAGILGATGHAAPAIAGATGLFYGLNYLQKKAMSAVANKVGNSADVALGRGLPPIMANIAAKRRLADRAGVGPSVTPGDIQALHDKWSTVGNNAAQARAATVRRMAQPSPAAVPPGGPVATPPASVQTPPGPSPAPGLTPQSQAGSPPPQVAPAAAAAPAPVAPSGTAAANLAGTRNPGWFGPITGTNGGSALEPNPMRVRQFMKNLVSSGQMTQQEHDDLMSQDHIGDALGLLQNEIGRRQLMGTWQADSAHPDAPDAGQSAPRQENPVRNPQAYQAAIDEAHAARDHIATTYPALALAAHAIANQKGPSAKKAAMEEHVMHLESSDDRAAARAILSKLTTYGGKDP